MASFFGGGFFAGGFMTSGTSQTFHASTAEEAIIKAMVHLCKPCCGHGNPGCCSETFPVCARYDLSYEVTGVPAVANVGSAWVENAFNSAECLPFPSENSGNWDTENCQLMSEFPGTDGEGPECGAGWLGGFASGTIKERVNEAGDPTIDSGSADVCFTCYEQLDGGEPACETRMFFCATYNYQKGMLTYREVGGGIIVDPPPGPPPPPQSGYLAYYSLDGGTPIYTSGVVIPTPSPFAGLIATPSFPDDVYAYGQAQFHKDVTGFSVASCDPIQFEVTDVLPWILSFADGLRYKGTYYTATIDGFACYVFEFETIPLGTFGPKISAAFTVS
jgi:hypothetical protein